MIKGVVPHLLPQLRLQMITGVVIQIHVNLVIPPLNNPQVSEIHSLACFFICVTLDFFNTSSVCFFNRKLI